MPSPTRSVIAAGLLGLALAAGTRADDFLRVRPGRGLSLESRPRRGQREVLHKRGVFVDMVATPELRKELTRLGYRLETLQVDIDEVLASLRRPGAGGFHRYWKMLGKIEGWRRKRPDLVQLYDLGKGAEVLAQGGYRRIVAARFTLGEGVKPRVLLFGGIHARELATTEVPLFLGDRLLADADSDPELQALLRRREVWLIPCLNPDGREYVFTHNPWWRKNRNLQPSGHMGVDLNRNFGYRWGPNPPNGGSSGNPSSGIYRGPEPFSEPETQALRDLVRSRPFAASVSLHSYGEMILTPFGYSRRRTEHPGLYNRLGSLLQQATSYQLGQVPDVLGYFSNGRHDDWLYADRSQDKAMVASVEMEIGRSFFPTIEECAGMAKVIGDGFLSIARMAGADLHLDVEPRSLPGGVVDVALRVRNLGIEDARQVLLRVERLEPTRRHVARRELGLLRGLGTQGASRPYERRTSIRVRGPVRTLRITAYAEGEEPVVVERAVPVFVD